MDFIPTTDAERQAMLQAIGAETIEELFSDIPDALRLRRPLDLPAGLSEAETLRHLRSVASRNIDLDQAPCFLGGGAYDHLIPTAVGTITGRAEFMTAYTPYQAEITQGVLQSIYEFQSLICGLTGLDVANASLYDGASALAEAAIMAVNATGRSRLLLASGVNPTYRRVVETYLRHQGVRIEVVPGGADGRTNLTALRDMAGNDVAAVAFQNPNFFGIVEDVEQITDVAKDCQALAVVSVDPISLGILRPPGDYGAAIAVGEAQPLGNPLAFGGPYVGFIAAEERLLRRMPGRLAGATTDAEGNRGYVLTLQTREQHIRRDRATSNICTNQAINALAATVYLSLIGPSGLRAAANLCLQKAHYAFDRLCSLPAFRPAFKAPFFKEFVLRCDRDPQALMNALAERGIIGGLPLAPLGEAWADACLFCVTEARTREEIDRLVATLEALTGATA